MIRRYEWLIPLLNQIVHSIFEELLIANNDYGILKKRKKKDLKKKII